MRAYWIIMLCISLLDLRGQRIAKIAYPSAAGISIQEGITFHYIIGVPMSGSAGSGDSSRIYIGFLQPVFSSFSTGVQEQGAGHLTIYPNPFSSSIFIRSTLPGEYLKFWLSDLNGRSLISGYISGRDEVLGTQALISGIYLLSLEDTKGHLAFYKLIKL